MDPSLLPSPSPSLVTNHETLHNYTSQALTTHFGPKGMNVLLTDEGDERVRIVSRVVSRVLGANGLGELTGYDSGMPLEKMEERWNSSRSVSKNEKKKWTLHIIDHPTPNAFATFGNIVIFTGLLSLLRQPPSSPSQRSSSPASHQNQINPHYETHLASILSHEIAHVTLNHAIERLSLYRFMHWFEGVLGRGVGGGVGVDAGFLRGVGVLGIE